MSLITDIDHGAHLRFFLQIVRTEVDTMIVAIGATMGHDTPHVTLFEAVERGKKLYHLTLEGLRRHLPRLVGHRIASIVQVDDLHPCLKIPFIEVVHLRLLVGGVAKIGMQTCFPH